MSNDKHSEIAQRARQIWQREGCPQGRADAHWKQAEEELAREAGQTGSSGQSAPYVPADDAMIEPDADSPVIAGASVPSKPPMPAAEAEQRKRAATAKSAGAAKPASTTRADSKAESDKSGSKSASSKTNDKKKKKRE